MVRKNTYKIVNGFQNIPVIECKAVFGTYYEVPLNEQIRIALSLQLNYSFATEIDHEHHIIKAILTVTGKQGFVITPQVFEAFAHIEKRGADAIPAAELQAKQNAFICAGIGIVEGKSNPEPLEVKPSYDRYKRNLTKKQRQELFNKKRSKDDWWKEAEAELKKEQEHAEKIKRLREQGHSDDEIKKDIKPVIPSYKKDYELNEHGEIEYTTDTHEKLLHLLPPDSYYKIPQVIEVVPKLLCKVRRHPILIPLMPPSGSRSDWKFTGTIPEGTKDPEDYTDAVYKLYNYIQSAPFGRDVNAMKTFTHTKSEVEWKTVEDFVLKAPDYVIVKILTKI